MEAMEMVYLLFGLLMLLLGGMIGFVVGESRAWSKFRLTQKPSQDLGMFFENIRKGVINGR